jgi:hypothetical protein
MTKSEKGMQGCFKNDRRTYDPAVVLDRHHFLMDIVTDFYRFNIVYHCSLQVDEFVKSHQEGWLSKNRQMQGARISRNEAYRGTPQ